MPRKRNASQIKRLLVPQSIALKPHASVTIIGGGLAGCAVARALADRGALVTILEREATIATQTSAHPAAVVFPMVAKYATPLRRFYAAGFEAIHQKMGELILLGDFHDWYEVGAIHLLVNDRLKHLWEVLQQTPMPQDWVQCWPAKEVALATQGRLRQPALYYPRAGHLNPMAMAKALIQHPAIVLQTFREAIALNPQPNGWHIATGSNQFEADALVLAAGLDVLRFPQTDWLPLDCVRGQLAYIPLQNAPRSPAQVICHEGYLIPNCAVGHIAGATFQAETRETQLKGECHQRLMDQLNRWLPGFLQHPPPMAGRVAFRAQSPDYLPMVGPVPDYAAFLNHFSHLHHGRTPNPAPTVPYHRRLFVSVGHASRGTISCWLAATLLAQLIMGGPAVLPDDLMSAINPGRFILRALRRNKTLPQPAIPLDSLPARLNLN